MKYPLPYTLNGYNYQLTYVQARYRVVIESLLGSCRSSRTTCGIDWVLMDRM